MITDSNKRIAVLIDGDNAEAAMAENILNEASRFGRVTIKRIYGDWTTQQMNSWKAQLNKFAIRPIQKFSYTKGKNSTDSALIIDAMDILFSKLVDGFCIVSSDSDYTGIAHRVREEGLFVMGIGKAHTPEAFVKACENFTYTEILKVPEKKVIQSKPMPKKLPKSKPGIVEKAPNIPIEPEIKSQPSTSAFTDAVHNKITGEPLNLTMVDNAYQMAEDELTGMALASQLGNALKKVDTSFDVRNYGFSSLRKFLEALKPRYTVVVHEDKTTISIRKSD